MATASQSGALPVREEDLLSDKLAACEPGRVYTDELGEREKEMVRTLGRFLTEGAPVWLFAAGIEHEVGCPGTRTPGAIIRHRLRAPSASGCTRRGCTGRGSRGREADAH